MGKDNNKAITTISLSDRIIDAILSVVMSFCIAFELITMLQFPYSVNVVLSIVLIITAIAFILLYNKMMMFISFVTTIAAVFLLTLGYLFSPSIRIGLYNFFNWIYGYIMGSVNLDKTYAYYALLLICFVVSFIVYSLVSNRLWVIPLILGAILFVVATQQMLSFSYFAFYVFDITSLLFYFRYIYHYNSKKGINKLIKQWGITFWLIPLCLIVCLIAYSMPVSQYPIQFKWLDDKINAYIQENYAISFDDFNVNKMGFGNSSTLGGIASPNSMEALDVKASKPIYLKGRVSDEYTGSEWINTDKGTVLLNASNSENTLQNYELQEGIKFLPKIQMTINTQTNPNLKPHYKNTLVSPSGINKSTYIDYDTVQVTYKQISTKTIFISDGLLNISIPNAQTLIDKNGDIRTQNSHSKNFSYQMDTYNFKYGDQTFQNILRKSKKGLYDQNINGVDNNVRNILKSRADAIYAKYLELPSTLPTRVTNLAYSITSSATNNYDKVKMIETYLATNMKYTLTPPQNPKSQDFVDYFLFDSKQGYCTYYATAMAVLVRSLGIPARYVEGYLMPDQKDAASGLYVVTNERAHAWVEVYFEGVGWVQFEPTTIYNQNFYSNSLVNIAGTNPNAAQAGSEVIQTPSIDDTSSISPSVSSSSASSVSSAVKPKSVSKTTGENKLYIFIFILLVLFVVISRIITNHIRIKNRIIRAFQMEPRQSILALYQYYLQLFTLLDLQIKPDETATEFAKRMAVTYDFFKELDFEGITGLFVIAKYSEHIMTESDKTMLVEFYNPFFLYFKSRCNKIRYLVNHYIFGIV